MSRLGMAVVLLAAALPAIAQDALPEVQAVSPPVETYRIGVDDVVQVSVWRNPDLSVSVPVRPDGKISVPLIGDVDAGGRHPQDVAEDIKGKLATYVRDPQVAVILTELRSHEYLARVRVTGAVRQPVSLPYRQGMSVLDAVLAAGGTNEFASADNTRLYRKEGDSVKTFPIKLDRILKKGDLSTNLPVQAGDVVTVPERAF
ncbi:MAG TPA: XrtA/PEP-CTERM system exopolysaccharide export protein [Dokdonella sp.]|uniref:XrtA/PEP-CTERM system exopolysaccharide export protein n=1 Tax=Dokdonella sp. TaxID=2291710 RepID=UPI002BA4B3DB|nr:XrtA/PEP-CTERM system exopolysaccharide export protein [Dokdonella sp.]HUD43672.1 XrtA/PEP-CTERM system exopolysaccharide export protein [Dokdonella sp.]